VVEELAADVVVIGAGFAGLSAATKLARAGRRVIVFEESPRLGGRASAFTDRETGERVDNGQHVLFGCYRETYEFLERIGTASLAPLQERLSLVVADRDGRSFQLSCPPLPPPWHLVAGVLGWGAVPVRDRLTAGRIGRLLLQARRLGAAEVASRVPPDETVSEWLARYRQSPQLCRWLWDPLAIAALNQSPRTAAAQSFVRVLAELFGPRATDAAIGLSRVPLDELYAEPAVRFIEARAGRVHVRSSARVLLDDEGRVRGVRAGEVSVATPAVISTVAWHAFPRLWDDDVPSGLAAIADAAARMRASPIVTVNLWFANTSMAAPFIGLVNGPMHWVFDKSALFGERAGHLSVVASGADDLVALDNAAITHAAVEQLRTALPHLASATLERAVVVREPRASFSLEPGSPVRPACRTSIQGFYLAGDWTDTGLPATIEGAVRSGHRAADCALGNAGV